MINACLLQRAPIFAPGVHRHSGFSLSTNPGQRSFLGTPITHSQVRPRFSMTAGAETVASASGAAQSPGILGGKIQGRTAIITGGSQGVGKVLAKKFAEAGFNVVVAARQADRLQVVADDLAKVVKPGAAALAVPTDITKAEDVAALAEKVLAMFEDVDVVCNNAGVCLTGSYAATTAEDFRSQMDVNFFGAVAVTSAFLPALKRTALRRPRSSRPVVAVVNSFASRIPLPSMAAYSASKAALASWVDSIRPELAKSDIHVAQIQPGVIRSDFLERAQFRGEKAQEAVEELKKVLETSSITQTPEQVADVTFNAIVKYKNEVTVGAAFKAMSAAHWLGLNPAAMMAK